MASELFLNVSILALGLMVLFLFLYILCYSDVLTGPSSSSTTTLHVAQASDREILRRENLADTILSDGEEEWQCVVCLHLNNPSVQHCHLCGASNSHTMDHTILGDTALLSTTVNRNNHTAISTTSTILSASSTSEFPMLEADQLHSITTRQRALRYRRLNRMQLTQRQRSAQRRRLWQRVQLADGGFLWVRSDVPFLHKKDSLLTRLRANIRRSASHESSELSDTIAEQIHRKNAATMGFYSELDTHTGEVSWKHTTDASGPIDVPITIIPDTQDAVGGEDSDDEEVYDLEGLMALPFKEKKRWFLRKMATHAVAFTESLCRVRVRRGRELEDSVATLTKPLSERQLREHLNIAFEGEPALDAGGVLREWFGIVEKALFKPELGLFVATSGENPSYWLNPLSKQALGEDHLVYFTFAGRFLGKAMLEGLVCDAHLALPLLKHVLGVPITFSDLEFLDEELYNSCKWLRDNENVESLCVTFSVQVPGSATDEIDLIPNGRNVDVTDANKHEYLAKVLQHRMLDAVAPQLGAMLKGLYDIVPKALLAVFDYQELDFFLCGLPTIDAHDWKTHSKIRHFADEGDTRSRNKEKRVVAWFWDVVQTRFSDDERARLLQFATGSSRVPVEGFKALTSASGYVHWFTLQLVPRGEPPAGLFPRAHTCFNRIDLPVYESREELETYLTLVIQMEITGFGLE